MLHHTIKITEFNRPMPITQRQLGKTNVGVYCQCGEFISFAVIVRPTVEYRFAAEQPVPVACPFCGHQELHHANEIVQLVLTDGNVRRHI